MKPGANLLNETNSAARVVLCNIAGDVVQIALDEAGEVQLHYFAMPSASAMA
jgi:hypothetical protein